MTINDLIEKLHLSRSIISGLLDFLQHCELAEVVGQRKSKRGTGALAREYALKDTAPMDMSNTLCYFQEEFKEPFTTREAATWFGMSLTYVGGLIRFLVGLDLAHQVGTRKPPPQWGGAPSKTYLLIEKAPEKLRAMLEELVRCNPKEN